MAPQGVGLIGLSSSSSGSKQSAERAKKKYNLPERVATYGDIAALVKDPNVDIVAIVVRAPEHYGLLKPALEARKDIFVEWPLAANLAEAEELVELVRASGIRTLVGLQGRQDHSVREARQMILDGKLGVILSTNLFASGVFFGPEAPPSFEYACDIENGANLVTIATGHSLDTLCYVLGEFKELHATLANHRTRMSILDSNNQVVKVIDKTAHDQVAITGILNRGAIATVVYGPGQCRTGRPFYWEINGTQGSLMLEIMEGTEGVPQLYHPTLRFVSAERGSKIKEIPVEGPTAPDFSWNVGMEWDAFAGQNDGSTPTFEDALVRHRMIEAIYRSNTSGSRERYV
ncbi:hypothetical protein H2204_000361 [Knufia peltigerae]|uniref:Oxidoreductase n=1 Tax=Knufia peltigerae TaxID=1002370 RepID=A0AA38YEH7_9EURO|nr:hypothetical protein H2204_000361 [Knufia peltigerae]